MTLALNIVVLAAGQGKRMNSRLPKVLQPLAGRPLLAHVLDCARALSPQKLVVVHGHGGEQVRAAFAGADDLIWVEQREQLGTGHAVLQALPGLVEGVTLVLYGDCPLITPATLQQLLAAAAGERLAILTAEPADPTGYGRIVRDGAGRVLSIVEHKDADATQKLIREINTGFLAAPVAKLRDWLPRLGNANAQGEYYLTDIVALAAADDVEIATGQPTWAGEADGVNDRRQLATMERALQRRQADGLLAAGVTLLDPDRFDLRGRLRVGRDVAIDVGCVFEGEVELGDDVKIGAHCVLKDVSIAAGTEVAPFSHLDGAEVGRDARIGPYARLRPGSRLADAVHIGNFVEVKNSVVGQGSKANHLTYLGDADVGAGVNIGAGTVTCNYDGANKWRTAIEDRVFVGSGSMLVAPVTIGAGATIGAGSTITRDAPAEQLTLERARQATVPGWQRPVKQKKA